jgi:hypothetical protein
MTERAQLHFSDEYGNTYVFSRRKITPGGWEDGPANMGDLAALLASLPPEKLRQVVPAESAPAPTEGVGGVTDAKETAAALLGSLAGYDLTNRPDTFQADLAELMLALAAAEARGAASAGRMAVRPLVRWFAEQMESALQRNDHKGGWHNDDPAKLAERIVGEYAELEIVLGGPLNRKGWLRVIEEAADVANMAMMVADHFREGGPSRDQGREGQAGPAVRVHHRELAAMLTQAERDGFAAGAASAIGRAGESEAGWIRCEERMPVPILKTGVGEECRSLVMAPARGVDMAAWDGERWVWRHKGYAIPSEVTHWRPLPAPPNPPPADPKEQP